MRGRRHLALLLRCHRGRLRVAPYERVPVCEGPPTQRPERPKRTGEPGPVDRAAVDPGGRHQAVDARHRRRVPASSSAGMASRACSHGIRRRRRSWSPSTARERSARASQFPWARRGSARGRLPSPTAASWFSHSYRLALESYALHRVEVDGTLADGWPYLFPAGHVCTDIRRSHPATSSSPVAPTRTRPSPRSTRLGDVTWEATTNLPSATQLDVAADGTIYATGIGSRGRVAAFDGTGSTIDGWPVRVPNLSGTTLTPDGAVTAWWRQPVEEICLDTASDLPRPRPFRDAARRLAADARGLRRIPWWARTARPTS